MKDVSTKVLKGMRGIFRPPPSLFDLCLAGFLALPFIQDPTKQKIFFIFYIIFLVCISMGQRPRREYHSLSLMFLSLWAFIGIFIHSFVIPCEESIVMRYLNMYILSEGFIYIFFGSLFLITVIRYSKNIKMFYVLVPIAMIPLLQQFRISYNLTFVFSLYISVAVYCILKRRWIIPVAGMFGAMVFAKASWNHVMMKWPARPYLFKQLIREIAKHPFVGSGFYHGLEHPDFMIWADKYGWVWRHNDYLSLGAYLGILATLFLVWFLIDSTKRIGIRLALIPVMAIAIMSFFQMNFFRIERAGVFLLIIALSIRQSYSEEEQ